MTTLLITTFCLGACMGMIYTYIVSRVIERKYKRINNKNNQFVQQ